jgi:hypothetical protein
VDLMLAGFAGSMMMAAARPLATSLALISAPTFSAATWTIPNDGSVVAGDLAVVLQRAINTAGTTSAPAEVDTPGWLAVRHNSLSTNSPQGIRAQIEAALLTESDLGATFTGVDGPGGDGKVLMLFRPNGLINAVAVEITDAQISASDPAPASISLGIETRLRLVVGHACATSSSVTTSGTLVTNGVSVPGVTTAHRSYYEIIIGAPPATRTIDMGDFGANILQIASLIFS